LVVADHLYLPYNFIKQIWRDKPMPTEKRLLKVFLCHASQDKPIVRELYQRLLAEGWIDPWLDEEKLLPGQDWDIEIEKAVEVADAVIVCLSDSSVKKEGYIQKELRFALNVALEKPEETIFIIPLRLDECFVPRSVRSIQYIDYFPTDRKDPAYQRVRESLKLRADSLGVQVIKSKLESSKAFQKVIQNELSAIQEFKIRSGDFFGKPLRMRQIAADEIKRLSMELQTDDILKFANSAIPGEKVAGALALGEKIITDATCSENPEVRSALLRLLSDSESRVRFRALQSIGYNKTLIKYFRGPIEKLLVDQNSSIKILSNSLLKKM
jgi:hypothetical protein